MHTAFTSPLSLQSDSLLPHSTPARRLCKRQRPVARPLDVVASRKSSHEHQNTRSNQSHRSDANNRRRTHNNSAIFKGHSEIEGLSRLPPTPVERTGYDGWREGKDGEEDDRYWNEMRVREILFRKGSNVLEEDFELAERPLDRHGKPATYSAAVHYDEESGKWIPTSEEEEERLRRPYPIHDPFFIKEAEEGEPCTSLKPSETGETEETGDENGPKTRVYGGFEFTEEVLVNDMSHHRRRRLDMPQGGWRVVHLGTSSAIPTSKRNVSSTAVLVKPVEQGKELDMFLVDAGENTDDRLIECDWCMTHGFRWIRAIFITHLHGDHIYGLPMLLATIGKYAQYRRRKALENGDDGSDPVVRVFGPYGTRGFVRASLYWTNPVGVRFSVAELVPREDDFRHVKGIGSETTSPGEIFVHEYGSDEIEVGGGVDLKREAPPPHPEEERVENIEVGEDGLWHVWEQEEGGRKLEVVAAPLRHRLPCFGYVFRESFADKDTSGTKGGENVERSVDGNGAAHDRNGAAVVYDIDRAKAKELGVHGTQLRVLRSGRPITVSKTGLVVRPEDVATDHSQVVVEDKDNDTVPSLYERKVTILGDTSDSSAIADAAMDSDLLVHEATFTERLRAKARMSMHSTAGMAGAFGGRIRARKIALTHFSSRYEMLHSETTSKQSKRGNAEVVDDEDEDENLIQADENEDEDFASPNQLVREAVTGYGESSANIVAAYDFLEHDIEPATVTGRDGVRASTPTEPFAVRTAHD